MCNARSTALPHSTAAAGVGTFCLRNDDGAPFNMPTRAGSERAGGLARAAGRVSFPRLDLSRCVESSTAARGSRQPPSLPTTFRPSRPAERTNRGRNKVTACPVQYSSTIKQTKPMVPDTLWEFALRRGCLVGYWSDSPFDDVSVLSSSTLVIPPRLRKLAMDGAHASKLQV